MITIIATWGWRSSTSTRRIVAVSIGGAVTSASRFVTCDSCSLVARIASSTSRRMLLSPSRSRGTGSAPPVISSSTYTRYPRSVGTRPADVCGCSSSPTSSRLASSARTVDGPQGTSSCSAIHLEPIGWSSSRWASTSLRSRNVWRGVSATRLLWRQLGLYVLDDLVSALLGLGGDDHAPLALLLHRAGNRDLLLGEPHPAELDGQPPQAPRIATGGVDARPGHLGHRPQAVEDVRGQAHLLRELGVDVDRVEVARRARVAVRQIPVRRDLEVDVHDTPLTMFVQVPRATSAPSWLVDTVSNT